MTNWVTHVHTVATWARGTAAPHWWQNPAWWQAILSAAAIPVSGLIAASVPAIDRYLKWKAEADERIQIVCSRLQTKTMEIRVTYKPARLHQAIDCRITLLEPKDGALVDVMGAIGRDAVQTVTSRMHMINTGRLECVFNAFANSKGHDLVDGRFRIEILTSPHPRLIGRRQDWLSAVNSTPQEERLLNENLP
jgi:hypothetical protein